MQRILQESASGVACFAIHRLIGHLNPWKSINEQGVSSEHLNNRLFTTASNRETSIYRKARHTTGISLTNLSIESASGEYQFRNRGMNFSSLSIFFCAKFIANCTQNRGKMCVGLYFTPYINHK